MRLEAEMHLRTTAWVRMAGTMVLSGALIGCGAGATWQEVEIEAGYQRPGSVAITVIASRLTREVADALGEAMVSELGRHRIPARIVPESSNQDDVRVTIGKWDPGSQGLRWLGGDGEGKIIVEVDSATLGVDGTARGWVRAGWFGGDEENSARA